MVQPDPTPAETLHRGEVDEPETVLIHANPAGAIARAIGTTGALALVAVITGTATMLTMSPATDIANAHFYSTKGVNDLVAMRWASGGRLVVAGNPVRLRQ